ncbi:hypothetical protein PpBr36_08742, partial [Pyricularia pennisetigena]|uniref:hypothetical protein n=1 Tax=Pyricularia pennisetigena TaxID=1578925 RepID=UPI0011536501
ECQWGVAGGIVGRCQSEPIEFEFSSQSRYPACLLHSLLVFQCTPLSLGWTYTVQGGSSFDHVVSRSPTKSFQTSHIPPAGTGQLLRNGEVGGSTNFLREGGDDG